MKIGMMLGFEDSIKTITQIAQEAEQAGRDVERGRQGLHGCSAGERGCTLGGGRHGANRGHRQG